MRESWDGGLAVVLAVAESVAARIAERLADTPGQWAAGALGVSYSTGEVEHAETLLGAVGRAAALDVYTAEYGECMELVERVEDNVRAALEVLDGETAPLRLAAMHDDAGSEVLDELQYAVERAVSDGFDALRSRFREVESAAREYREGCTHNVGRSEATGGTVL